MLAGAIARGRGGHGGYQRRRRPSAARASLRSLQTARLYRQPKTRHGSLPRYSTRCSLSRGGSRLAVQPSSVAWALHASRTDPHHSQLERRVARPRWIAEPERIAYQGGRKIQFALERRFPRRFLPQRIATLAGWR